MITKVANKVWSKKISTEWTWVQVEAILGLLWAGFILASGGNYNIIGMAGMSILAVWVLILLLAVFTYPFMQPIHKR